MSGTQETGDMNGWKTQGACESEFNYRLEQSSTIYFLSVELLLKCTYNWQQLNYSCQIPIFWRRRLHEIEQLFNPSTHNKILTNWGPVPSLIDKTRSWIWCGTKVVICQALEVKKILQKFYQFWGVKDWFHCCLHRGPS